jgi:hypothetical protein
MGWSSGRSSRARESGVRRCTDGPGPRTTLLPGTGGWGRAGSDPEEPFVDVVWWVDQEVLHHAAEIALLRDLYRARQL